MKRIPGPDTNFTDIPGIPLNPPALPWEREDESELEEALRSVAELSLVELPKLLRSLNVAVQTRKEQTASINHSAALAATLNAMRVIESGTKAGGDLSNLLEMTTLIRDSLYIVSNVLSRDSRATASDFNLQNTDMVSAVGDICHELEAIAAKPCELSEKRVARLCTKKTAADRVIKSVNSLLVAYAAELPLKLSDLRSAIEESEVPTSCLRFKLAKNKAQLVIRAIETAEKIGAEQGSLLLTVQSVLHGLYTITNSMSHNQNEAISASSLANKSLVAAVCKTLSALEARLKIELAVATCHD